MATTFNVISLGQQALIDTLEGNSRAENASVLENTHYGDNNAPLYDNIQTLSEDDSADGNRNAYDQTGTSDTFQIDNGPPQTFDACAVYEGTVTYTDGTTATFSAVVFQDVDGNTYLAPEMSENSDQAVLTSQPIVSLDLGRTLVASTGGLSNSRAASEFLTCFSASTLIETDLGAQRIDTLTVGSLVMTQDAALQPIRWISRRLLWTPREHRPIEIAAGALGNANGTPVPKHNLRVSPQHRILLTSKIAQRMFGSAEVLIAAKKLLHLPGVSHPPRTEPILYFHLLLDDHQIIYANGLRAETLLAGPITQETMPSEVLEELDSLCTGWRERAQCPARPLSQGARLRTMLGRHQKNQKRLQQ